MTDLPKQKQALAVVLVLQGRARIPALEINAAALNIDEEISTRLGKLGSVFKKEDVDCAYEAYATFEKFTRAEGSQMSSYIHEFEDLYEKAKRHKMVLPDAILAYKLLDNAGLDVRERQMVLSACNELKYEDMKRALRRIFGETVSSHTVIKDEPTFFGSSRGKYRQKWKPYEKKPQKGKNPVGRDGRPLRCSSCGLINPFWQSCPDRQNEVTTHEVRMLWRLKAMAKERGALEQQTSGLRISINGDRSGSYAGRTRRRAVAGRPQEHQELQDHPGTCSSADHCCQDLGVPKRQSELSRAHKTLPRDRNT